jgi:hypothetical protein
MFALAGLRRFRGCLLVYCLFVTTATPFLGQPTARVQTTLGATYLPSSEGDVVPHKGPPKNW